MKRFVAVLSGLLIMPAFAEVAPVYYDDVIEYSDAELYDGDVVADENIGMEENVNSVAAPNVSVRNATRSSSRATRSIPTTATARPSATAPSRAVASRAAANISQTRSAMTRGTASRAASSRATNSQNISTRRATRATNPATAARASIVQTDTVNTPLYTGRVGVRTVSGGGAAVSSRAPTVRVANSTVSSTTATTSLADVTTSMDELAQITDFCKAQYTECMDNFCNVLDDNQGRCSCSKNIKNYAKTEEALKEATESLQDVAQKIQYIGLTGDEIETLFDQTEAELAMQGSSDSSQIKTDLDKIKNMIVDIKAGTASSSEVSSGISMDLSGLLDFNIGSTGFDLSGLFGTTTANTASISNQRGEELYKTAASRCKAAVLNSCSSQGVDIAVITNSYDLEIDKQCVAYERSLTDANDQMRSTVRNAQSVLQKARLMVAQQKNSYDLRGCVNALDSCMQDDFVCGTDYENCLDPSGKYIVNGEIVLGSTPGSVIDDSNPATVQTRSDGKLYSTWNYDTSSCVATGTKNAWVGQTGSTAGATEGSLADYIEACMINETTDSGFATSTVFGLNQMAPYLMRKIGHNLDGKNKGMCISVLNKCQKYTYDDNGKYIPNNDVIREYLKRTLVAIKSAQDEVIYDYAENCLADVSSCLSQNNYSTSVGANNNIAINACNSVLKTCYSVNGKVYGTPSPTQLQEFAKSIMGCPDGQEWVVSENAATDTTSASISGECKVKCDTGKHRDSETLECVDDEDNSGADTGGGN